MAHKLPVVSAVEALTTELRRQVLSGDLTPGAALGEMDLAQSFGVARPTARAAIENLVRERLLEREAYRSARVRVLTPDDVRDIYRTRGLIEAEALRRLAEDRRTPESARAANDEIVTLAGGDPRDIVEPDMRFHRSLIDALDSPRTSRMYDALASEVVFCMSQVQGAELLPAHLIAEEHAHILDLIAAGDGEAAAQALRTHLSRAQDLLAARLTPSG